MRVTLQGTTLLFGFCFAFSFALGCVLMQADGVERRPGSANPGADFTDSELDACSEIACRSFIAPCILLDPDRKKPLSAMEEQYFELSTAYLTHGYCARVPRVLSEPNYPPGTCIFIFMKQESCR